MQIALGKNLQLQTYFGSENFQAVAESEENLNFTFHFNQKVS